MVNGRKSNVTLNKTLHTPELRMNLLSVSKVTDKGYRVVFDEQKAEVIDQRGQTRLMAKRSGDLYLIEGTSPHNCQNAEEETKKSGKFTKLDNIIRSWHRRMGHLNFRDLVHASKSGARYFEVSTCKVELKT